MNNDVTFKPADSASWCVLIRVVGKCTAGTFTEGAVVSQAGVEIIVAGKLM